jgi:hypothetical protein
MRSVGAISSLPIVAFREEWEKERLMRCSWSPPSKRRKLSSILYQRQVTVRLPGKGNSNSYVARSVHLTITMIEWIRTSKCSIKNSLATPPAFERGGNNLNGFQEFRTENSSSQGRNLAMTVLCVPNSLEDGPILVPEGLGFAVYRVSGGGCSEKTSTEKVSGTFP